jgi:hypothetical protein
MFMPFLRSYKSREIERLPFSRHFPEALTHVLQLVAVRTAAETRPAAPPSAPRRVRRPHPKRAPARARGVKPRAGRAPQDTPPH